jgi:signal peptidase
MDKESVIYLLRDTLIVFTILVILPTVIAGTWPPYVSITSGSMIPNIYAGDLVVIFDSDRSHPGTSPHKEVATVKDNNINTFNRAGNVIVYRPNGSNRQTSIIHRAAFWVEEGENWYKKANKSNIRANSCSSLSNCPSPSSGYITIGDNNRIYDQAAGLSSTVKPQWIIGVAKLRIPHVGWISVYS